MNKKKGKYWKKKLSLVNWLSIIGGLILFSSWIVEKNKQSKWSEEKDSLKRSQLVIDIAENQRVTLETAYFNEIRKSDSDEMLIAFYQKGLTRNYLNLLTWSKGRVSESPKEYSSLMASKKKIIKENLTFFRNGKFEKIKSNFTNVAEYFGTNFMKLDADFSDKYDLVEENENYWNKVFSLLYILGSLLIGLSYLLEHTKEKK